MLRAHKLCIRLATAQFDIQQQLVFNNLGKLFLFFNFTFNFVCGFCFFVGFISWSAFSTNTANFSQISPSVTKFVEISPLWRKFKALWQFLRAYLGCAKFCCLFWQHNLRFWANFHYCKWPKLKAKSNHLVTLLRFPTVMLPSLPNSVSRANYFCRCYCVFNMGQTTVFCLFSSFSQHNGKYSTKFDYMKALMVCSGFELGTGGWLAQSNPLSNGGPFAVVV